MAYLKFKLNIALFLLIVLQNVQALSQTRTHTISFYEYVWQKDGRLQRVEGSASLEDGKVNLTPFFTAFEEALKQSHHENTYNINELSDLLSGRQEVVVNLCEALFQDHQIRTCKEDLSIAVETQKTRFLEQQSQRLLYPDWYVPRDITYLEDHFDEFLTGLRQIASHQNNPLCKEGVDSFCKDYRNRKFFLYSPSRQYEQALRTLNRSGLTQKCLRAVLHDQVGKFALNPFSRMPQTCQRLSETDQKVCQGMKNDFSVFQERVKNIMTHIEPESEHIRQSYADSSDLKSSISDFFGEHGDTINCPNYAIGEERIHQRQDYKANQYSVKKEQDGNYTVTIPVIFSAGDDYDGAVPKDQVHSHYLERTRRQMNELKPYLLGPNGQQLNIVIIDGKSSHPCLTPNKITIEDRHHTANSITYPSDINRLTALHELGHTMGLSDEYEMVSYGRFVDANGRITYNAIEGFKCRMTQTNSLMNSQDERFRNIRYGNNSSLLDPTHFNVILYGICQERTDVNLYNQCSALAYNEDFNNSDCPPLKNQCESSNVLRRRPYQNKEIREVADENERVIRELQSLDDCSQFQGRIHPVNIRMETRRSLFQILPLEAIDYKFDEEEEDSYYNRPGSLSYELRFIDLNDTSKGLQKAAIYREPPSSIYDIWKYSWYVNKNSRGEYYPFQLDLLNPDQRHLSNCWVKRTVGDTQFQTDQNSPVTPRQTPTKQDTSGIR